MEQPSKNLTMPFLKSRDSAKDERRVYHNKMQSTYGVEEAGDDEYKCKIACVFWTLGLCCCCGCHRCYTHRYCTGTAWFCTLGCLGICQVYDLFHLSWLVDKANTDGGADWG